MCLWGGYTAREQPLCTACYPSNLIDFQQKFVWELMLILAELTHFWREKYAQLLWTNQHSLPSEIYRKELSQCIQIRMCIWKSLAHLPNPFVKSNVTSGTWHTAH